MKTSWQYLFSLPTPSCNVPPLESRQGCDVYGPPAPEEEDKKLLRCDSGEGVGVAAEAGLGVGTCSLMQILPVPERHGSAAGRLRMRGVDIRALMQTTTRAGRRGSEVHPEAVSQLPRRPPSPSYGSVDALRLYCS